MENIDDFELKILESFEKNEFKSIATKDELGKFKMAARATAIKDKRVNIRLSSGAAQHPPPHYTPGIALCKISIRICTITINTMGDKSTLPMLGNILRSGCKKGLDNSLSMAANGENGLTQLSTN